MLKAYSQAASTLNLLRAFADGGYADLRHVNSWNMGFVKSGPQGERYRYLAHQIQESLNFMEALGITSSNTRTCSRTDFPASSARRGGRCRCRSRQSLRARYP